MHLLETIVERLEEFDQLKKRPRVYAHNNALSSDEDEKVVHRSTSPSAEGEELHPKDKLKQLSFELIDIGVHSSQLAVDMLQKTEIYQGL